MVKGRSVLATIGSLALVLVISFPVFATEEETPSSGDDTGTDVVVVEPVEPVVPEPVEPEPDVPTTPDPEPEPEPEPTTPENNETVPTSQDQPKVEEKAEEPVSNTQLYTNPAPSYTGGSSKKSESSDKENKSNNVRISKVMFGDIVADYSDGEFIVKSPNIDPSEKKLINVVSDNSSAKVDISDPKISGKSAVYTITVTAADGTKREYSLRVQKVSGSSAATTATASGAASNSASNSKPKSGSGKGPKILIASLITVAAGVGAYFFWAKFLKKSDENLPNLSGVRGKFKEAFAWNVAKKDDNILKSDELSDEAIEDIRKEINNG